MKRVSIILMICLIYNFSSAQTSKKYLQIAQTEFMNHHIDAAISNAQNATKADMNNDEAFSFLAKCFLLTYAANISSKLGNEKEALRYHHLSK